MDQLSKQDYQAKINQHLTGLNDTYESYDPTLYDDSDDDKVHFQDLAIL